MVILLFGAGTDYGLLLISRYREELRHEPRRARRRWPPRSARPGRPSPPAASPSRSPCSRCSFAQYGDYRSFAPVLGLGVFVTLIAGLTLMPALLAVLGRRAFWPRVPKQGDATRARAPGTASPRRWPRRRAAPRRRRRGDPRRPGARLPLLQPALQLHRGLPQGHAVQAGLRAAREALPQGRAGADDRAHQGAGGAARVRHRHDHRRPQQEPRRRRRLPHRHGRRRQAARLPGDPQGRPVLEARRCSRCAQLRRSRARRPPRAGAWPWSAARRPSRPTRGPSATATPSWWPSSRSSWSASILALLLRALVAPLYLLLTNVLSYLAALGATIVITEKLLGWEHISYRIPLYMFIFLVALGSDYNIFITTRIRSEAMAARAPRRHGEGAGGHRRRAHERRHHPGRHVPDPAVAAGQGPRRDQHRRGARRAHRHVPGAHGAGAGAHALDRPQGRLAGAALDERGATADGEDRPRAPRCRASPSGTRPETRGRARAACGRDSAPLAGRPRAPQGYRASVTVQARRSWAK